MGKIKPRLPPKKAERTSGTGNKPTRLIRLPEVKARVGLSRSSIYQRISENTFPAPVRLGARSVAWNEASIDSWINDRLEGGRAA